MAGFLDEFVKLTVNETIETDYPHIRHPAPVPGKGDGRDREGWGIVCDAAAAKGKRGDG